MYKLPIALLLASAAATSQLAMAAQPTQNTTNPQHKQIQHVRGRANPANVRPNAGERRIANKTGNPPASVSPQTSTLPEFRQRRRVENVEQHRTTVTPPIENRQANRVVTQPRNIQRTRPPVVSRVPRIGTEPPIRAERANRPRPQWNRNWRNNRQYDWGNWRQRNRSVFHLHRYRDPYGWAYRLFSIGWRLWPQYYSSSYWIDDPSMYRLPPAPPGTRWIRYYNDALLVDMWTGEVIDVIPNFFW
jgi:Ni/Co efflux regulator RcnB